MLTDFGSCLAQQGGGLTLPFTWDGISRGGNPKLMAPEIACAEPGPDVSLDYSKSDLWAAAAIAYEIFNTPNPFYNLDSRTYRDSDLPDVQGKCKLAASQPVFIGVVAYSPTFLAIVGVPHLLNRLIKSMLARDPQKVCNYAKSAVSMCMVYICLCCYRDQTVP